MRGLIGKLVVIALLPYILSCNETVEETWVWGTFEPDSNAASETPIDGSAERPLEGTLKDKGGDYIGSCIYTNKRFSFTVASSNKNTLGAADFYYEINGIDGPPSKNPYNDQGTPRDDEERSFQSGFIATSMGEWSIQSEDINERCRVSLFSEAGSGDLTPVKYGKKPFEYLLTIDCIAGLDSVENAHDAAVALNGLNAELWFDNCE